MSVREKSSQLCSQTKAHCRADSGYCHVCPLSSLCSHQPHYLNISSFSVALGFSQQTNMMLQTRLNCNWCSWLHVDWLIGSTSPPSRHPNKALFFLTKYLAVLEHIMLLVLPWKIFQTKFIRRFEMDCPSLSYCQINFTDMLQYLLVSFKHAL